MEQPSVPLIRVERLSKEYKHRGFRTSVVRALEDVSLEVSGGRIVGILGPNGAGKSTLFKILVGLVRPTTGYVRILEKSPEDPLLRRDIGYLPENFRLPEFFTPSKALRIAGRLYSMSKSELEERADSLLKFSGLSERASMETRSLSKGMLQRLGLVLSLLNNPRILILDEPLDGVDAEGRRLFKESLIRLVGTGRIVLVSTHILADAEELCNEVIILSAGRILGKITREEMVEPKGYSIYVQVDRAMTATQFEFAGHVFVAEGEQFKTELTESHDINAFIARLQRENMKLTRVEPRKPSLEQLYSSFLRGADVE